MEEFAYQVKSKETTEKNAKRFVADSSLSETYEKAPTMIYKRYMQAAMRCSSLVSHVPFSRFFVAGTPAVSEDYAARCIRFSAYARDATTY